MRRQSAATALTPPALALEPAPGVLEAECPVEDEPLRRRVRIRAEIAKALELHGLTNRQLRERRLDQALLEHCLRVGVDVAEKVTVSAVKTGLTARGTLIPEKKDQGRR